MRPLILNNVVGQAVRVNPMNVIGWAPAEIPIPDTTKVLMGTALALTDGARVVRESPEQVDFLFERATDGWMRPPVTRDDLERWMAEVREREAAAAEGGAA